MTQIENSSLIVMCSAQQGSQPLFFEWFKNGDPIKPGPKVDYRIENSKIFSTLAIERISRTDNGNYTCLVKNVAGTDSQNVLLIVKGKDSITLKLC